jgi:hypothetical protein
MSTKPVVPKRGYPPKGGGDYLSQDEINKAQRYFDQMREQRQREMLRQEQHERRGRVSKRT